MSGERPQLRISVFMDYVCPFCFIGSGRLMRLEDTYDLRVNWCFVEIHPDTPIGGIAPDELDYSEGHWATLNASLAALAAADGLELAPRRLVPNTRHALRMAETAKDLGREPFYRLHRALLQAYFIDGRDIGDDVVLRTIAADCGLPTDLPDQAWGENPTVDARFDRYRAFAAAAGVSGVPTFVFGQRTLAGVQNEDTLRAAAAELSTAENTPQS
ncbi:MAG: DsbA family protein [Acidihalobacter sp.]|jgi:predicted DsbA family dithiol-disulfide isomerase